MELKDYLTKQAAKRSAELDEIKARLDALEKINNESEDEEELKAASEELDALKAKKEELEAELDEVNAQIAELEKTAEEESTTEEKAERKFFKMKKEERGKVNMMNKEKIEERAKKFVETKSTNIENEELRSVLVSSGTLATPTELEGINDNGFAKVSSILDLVKVENCTGMGSNKVAYIISDSTAAAHTEGEAITPSDPTFGIVTIAPTEIAVLSSISKQAKKQTPLQYEAKVRESALLALRREAAKIVTNAAVNSPLTTALELAALDAKAVRTITFSYGGNEGIEGQAYLLLNKKDLITLGDVRGTNEKKAVFEITPNNANPNTGTIKDGGLVVNYCINNNLAEGTLLYGQPKNLELDLFSDYNIEVSGDFYFDKLMDAIRGDVQLGADVIVKDGFVKATVKAA